MWHLHLPLGPMGSLLRAVRIWNVVGWGTRANPRCEMKKSGTPTGEQRHTKHLHQNVKFQSKERMGVFIASCQNSLRYLEKQGVSFVAPANQL